jgi:hypothetical protein
MLLVLLTLALMAALAYAYWGEGPLIAFSMAVNILLAGLLTFNFYEPIADLLAPSLEGSFAEAAEDAIAMGFLFLPLLMLGRWLTFSLANTHIEYPPILYRAGGVAGGLLGGYLLAGFLVCAFQTLPLQREFLTFEVYEPAKTHGLRKFMPPDLVWLAMMQNLSRGALTRGKDENEVPILFDPHGTYELRYSRYHRLDEVGKPMIWHGEVDP